MLSFRCNIDISFSNNNPMHEVACREQEVVEGESVKCNCPFSGGGSFCSYLISSC